MNRTVTTQAELDAALTEAREHPDDYFTIDIRSERGVWLVLREASGSATVRASDSATVEASGSATVRAFDSATVRASGSATVEASDSATVEASGSATVRASDSATVRAFDSATVRAFGSATVEAGSHTAVHLHSGRATITGGVLIDHTTVDLTNTTTWAGYHGCRTDGDHLVAYKAVRDDYRSQRGTTYLPGTTATCDDFTDVDECGGGLHFSPTPAQAKDYDREATRFVELRVPTSAVRTITGAGTPKAKAQTVTCVREVDLHGRPVSDPAATT